MSAPFGPEAAEFILISFEGPDRYSMAGGLGTRMAELSRAFAEGGCRTHLVFVGDPDLPPREEHWEGRLVYHRWAQWISRHHPNGVYDGEDGKVADFRQSLPPYLLQEIIQPAIQAGRVPVVMAEEWHTAACATALSDHLHWAGIRNRCVILWNANNTMGFEHVDWQRLNFATAITAVSRFMKQAMWAWGVDPVVIPNGIPKRWLEPVDSTHVADLRSIFPNRLMLAKVARFDPDKRWHQAIAAVAELKKASTAPEASLPRPVFIAKGGIEPHGAEVLMQASYMGLKIQDVRASDRSRKAIMSALARATDADIVNIQSFVPEEVLRALYCAADAVLANSGREPFGLVGLEVMACGGVVLTGATGEDYVRSFENGIAVESSDHQEITTDLEILARDPDLAARIRTAGRATAERCTWDHAIENLRYHLPYIARHQGVIFEG